MEEKFLSTDFGKSQTKHVETTSDPKSMKEEGQDVKPSSLFVPQLQTFFSGMFQLLWTNTISQWRNGKTSEMVMAAKSENKTDDECSFHVSKLQWKLMRNKIKNEKNELVYDDEGEILLVKGQNVNQFMKSFEELKESIKECRIPLDEKQETVFRSEYAEANLTLGMQDVKWTIGKGYINIFGLGEWAVKKVKEMVDRIIDDFGETTVPNNISDEEITWCKNQCEKRYLVHISSDVQSISIIGQKDAVSEVKKYFESTSRRRSWRKPGQNLKQGSVMFSETHYNLLMIFYGRKLDVTLENVMYNWEEEIKEKLIIKLYGSLEDVMKAEEDLKTIQESIKTEEIDVSAEFDCTRSLHLTQRLSSLSKNDPLFVSQESFGKLHKCIVKNIVQTKTLSKATSQESRLFQVNSSIQLEIKNYGNIIKEHSDVLVCTLPEHKTLTSTFVGKAFSSAIPGLENKFSRLDFSDNKVAFMDINLPGSPCSCVAFVILPIYSGSMSQRKVEISFRKSVQELLLRASGFDARTICFPPLGHGRMMKYPEGFISEHFFSALKLWQNMKDIRIKKITFLAPDKKLYEKMTCDGPDYFAPIIKSCESGGSDDSDMDGDFDIQEKNVLIQLVHLNSNDVAEEWKLNLERLSEVPSRGSVAFMKYKASLGVSLPPYWTEEGGAVSSLHPVDAKIRQSIENLLIATWDSAKAGLGKDAKGISRKSTVEFVSVQRVECAATFRDYAEYRNRILHRKIQEGEICQSIDEVSSNSDPVLTSTHLPGFMKHELCGEINEHYLFHGTKQNYVEAIVEQGCDPKLTSPSAMFGQGIYAAESSTKADQYTDDRQSRLPSGSIHTIFLLRVLLGDVFRCTKQHPSVSRKDADKLVRPPCKACNEKLCSHSDIYDSVMGEDGWIFREFVVYKSVQCYPEYCIQYKRV